MGTRRQANGCNRIVSTLIYDNSGTDVCASTIEIPDGWTPQLFLGLLLQEWCLSNDIFGGTSRLPGRKNQNRLEMMKRRTNK
jgi:hypothetical protein